MSLILFLSFFGFYFTPAQAQVISPYTIDYSSTTAQLIIESYAAKYHTPSEPLVKTLQCESHLNPVALGDNGLAHGVAQIRSDYWPDISLAQANNPFFSINFIAKAFSEGHQNWWSCYRNLYGSRGD